MEPAQNSQECGQPRLVWMVMRLYFSMSSSSKAGMGASFKSKLNGRAS